jgi:hypothetical protein
MRWSFIPLPNAISTSDQERYNEEVAYMSTLDFSGLNEPIKELAKAQVQVGIAAVTLVRLASGDVVVSVMVQPGDKTVPYARFDKLTRTLQLLAVN